MEKFTCFNYNPTKARIGDCVLRAITAFEYVERKLKNVEQISSEELYEKVKLGITSYGDYTLQRYFEKYLSEHGYVRVEAFNYIDNIRIRTENQLAMFCKNFNVMALALSNTHMAYVDPILGVVDTWDSRRKRLEYFYIKEEDVERLELKLTEDVDGNTNIKRVSTKENIIGYNKINGKSPIQMGLK